MLTTGNTAAILQAMQLAAVAMLLLPLGLLFVKAAPPGFVETISLNADPATRHSLNPRVYGGIPASAVKPLPTSEFEDLTAPPAFDSEQTMQLGLVTIGHQPHVHRRLRRGIVSWLTPRI